MKILDFNTDTPTRDDIAPHHIRLQNGKDNATTSLKSAKKSKVEVTTSQKKLLKELSVNECQKKIDACTIPLKLSIYVPKPFIINTTNGLTNSIIRYFQLHNHFAERISTQGTWDAKNKTYRHSTGTKGSADISAIVNGRSVKIEVKFGKDVLSDAQKSYAEKVRQSGALYYVAKDFFEFINWFNLNFATE